MLRWNFVVFTLQYSKWDAVNPSPNSQFLFPRATSLLEFQKLGNTSVTILGEEIYSFLSLHLQSSSCSMATTNIVHKSIFINDQVDNFDNIHAFYIDKKFKLWLTAGPVTKWIISIKDESNCSIKVKYEDHHHALCSRFWFGHASMCYDYWFKKTIEYPLCLGMKCYDVIRTDKKMSWRLAQNTCHQIDATLITVNSYEELNILRAILLITPQISERILFGLNYPNGHKVMTPVVCIYHRSEKCSCVQPSHPQN